MFSHFIYVGSISNIYILRKTNKKRLLTYKINLYDSLNVSLSLFLIFHIYLTFRFFNTYPRCSLQFIDSMREICVLIASRKRAKHWYPTNCLQCFDLIQNKFPDFVMKINFELACYCLGCTYNEETSKPLSLLLSFLFYLKVMIYWIFYLWIIPKTKAATWNIWNFF